MADEREDLPPIGTAQNAADVARKAELEAANKSDTYTHDMTAQELVDWTNRRRPVGEQIARLFGELSSTLQSLGPSSVAELHLDYSTHQALVRALHDAFPKTTSLLHAEGVLKLAGISIKCAT